MLRHGTPDGEGSVLAKAGYWPARIVPVRGRHVLERSIEDVVASVFSRAASAPHLFGAKLPTFESELRELFQSCSDGSRFSPRRGDTQLDFSERP